MLKFWFPCVTLSLALLSACGGDEVTSEDVAMGGLGAVTGKASTVARTNNGRNNNTTGSGERISGNGGVTSTAVGVDTTTPNAGGIRADLGQGGTTNDSVQGTAAAGRYFGTGGPSGSTSNGVLGTSGGANNASTVGRGQGRETGGATAAGGAATTLGGASNSMGGTVVTGSSNGGRGNHRGGESSTAGTSDHRSGNPQGST
jgi:hypothetical protein